MTGGMEEALQPDSSESPIETLDIHLNLWSWVSVG